MKSSSRKIEIGERFFYWEVIAKGKGKSSVCLCRGCGKIQKTLLDCILLRGSTKSCGCMNNEIRKQKARERYGVDNISQAKAIKEKKKQTTLENHGVLYPMQSEKVREKAKESLLRDWGVEHISQHNSIKERKSGSFVLQDPQSIARREEECLKQFGVKNHAQVDCFKKKQQATMLERHGVLNPSQSAFFQEKKQQRSQANYGTDYPGQSQVLRQKRLDSLDKEGLSAKFSDGRFVSFVCDEVGVANKSHIYNLLRYQGEEVALNFLANYKTKSPSDVECMFAEIMKPYFPTIELHNRKPLETNQIANRPDFRLEHNGRILYVNLDGLYYHSELCLEDPEHHLKVFKRFAKHNLSLFQFRMNEVRDKPLVVRGLVLDYLGLLPKCSGDRCLIAHLDKKQGNLFLKEHSLIGEIGSSRFLALTFEERTLGILAYREQGDSRIEVVNYTKTKDQALVGGFVKLINHLASIHQGKTFVLFQDLRYQTSLDPIDAGFSPYEIKLDWRWTDLKTTFHKRRCQTNMDARRLSEKDYARELGWYKIFDAGKRRWILNRKV